jgi:hypothetical protein
VSFLGAKGLNVKDIHKEMFPAYGGKCLCNKAVQNWVEKFSQGRSKVAVKRLLCYGFRRTGKAMGQVYQCREINVLSMFEYHMFHFSYQFVTYLLSIPIYLNEDLLSLKNLVLLAIL